MNNLASVCLFDRKIYQDDHDLSTFITNLCLIGPGSDETKAYDRCTALGMSLYQATDSIAVDKVVSAATAYFPASDIQESFFLFGIGGTSCDLQTNSNGYWESISGGEDCDISEFTFCAYN